MAVNLFRKTDQTEVPTDARDQRSKREVVTM